MGKLQQPRNKNDPSFKLRLIANNSKFDRQDKSVIRYNLGWCKHSEIYLI